MDNGWSEYEKLILFRLDETDRKLDRLAATVDQLSADVTVTKLKLALIGVVTGGLGTAAMQALVWRWTH